MKRTLPFILLAATASLLLAQMPPAPRPNGSNSGMQYWGTPTDPDGDCTITGSNDSLVIRVPGSRPHDLSPELNSTNAPRVLTPVDGDFKHAVQVSGTFNPGAESTQPARFGYNGAGIVLLVDEQNSFSLCHGVFQRPGETQPVSYVGFGLCVNGKTQDYGSVTDRPVPPNSPVYLSLERHGQKIAAMMSVDGDKWELLGIKDIPADWPRTLQFGVIAVSTSTREFSPRFSK